MAYPARNAIDEARDDTGSDRAVHDQSGRPTVHRKIDVEPTRHRAVVAQTGGTLRACGTRRSRRACRTRGSSGTLRTLRSDGTDRTSRADRAHGTNRALRTSCPGGAGRTRRTSRASGTRRTSRTSRARNAATGARTRRAWRTSRTGGTSRTGQAPRTRRTSRTGRALGASRTSRTARPRSAVAGMAKVDRERIVLTRQSTAGHDDVIRPGREIVRQADRDLVLLLLDEVKPDFAKPHRDRASAKVSAQSEDTLGEIRMSALQRDGTVVNARVMRKRRSSRAQEKRERKTECLVVWHLALRMRDGAPDRPPSHVATRGAETAALPCATIRPIFAVRKISDLTLVFTR